MSPKTRNLHEIILFANSRETGLTVRGEPVAEIENIVLDSRKVRAGDMFVALAGSILDGREFIPAAIAQGAKAILCDHSVGHDCPDDVLVLQSENPARLGAKIASLFYAPHPAQQILITGTNGKTSVADYTRQLGLSLGISAASVGTLGVNMRKPLEGETLTSPDSVSLARILGSLAKMGVTQVAMEASSHGLDQHRLDGTKPSVGVFTGLGRDHLDYHQSEEQYLAAKLRLFRDLLPAGATAIYAAQKVGAAEVQEICDQRGIAARSYGIGAGDIAATITRRHPQGMDIVVSEDGQDTALNLPLVGDFQCLNVLAAYGAVCALGADPKVALQGLACLMPVTGRMQHVGRTPKGAEVYVDYAHTPDALATVLANLRAYTQKIWLGFGCGGDRDAGKRPLMGEVSCKANQVVVTDDNPRGEAAANIRAQVLAGNPDALEMGDRYEAIGYLCTEAGAGDIVLIAGKGHEQGQIVGGAVLPFDDAEVARVFCTPQGGGA